jgi:prepilin-type N-terminal cleavage/methylation domain-containing protein
MKPAVGRTQRGFTLIELAVVLTIIAIVIGMSADMSISVVATARLAATQKKMKTVNDALMQFRTATDRLPCPGDLTLAPGSANYGVEGATPGTCTGGTPAANHTGAGATNTSATAAEGALPAVTLGLSPDFMLDGWGNKLRYAVDIAYTAKGAFANTGAGCVNGAITVKDGNENARSTGSIYALISHGPNGHGAYTPAGVTVNAGSSSADELTNCHCNSSGVYNSAYAPSYVQKLPAYDAGETGNALYYFDDIVSYKERWQMRTDWDKAGGCGYIYVTDMGNNRVQVFNTNGTWVGSIGGTSSACTSCMCTAASCPTSSGGGNGQLNYPNYISIDAGGNLWVTSALSGGVVEYSSNGTFLEQFSQAQGEPFIVGNAVSSAGNVWVAGNSANNVAEYNSSGTYQFQIGACSSGACSTGSGNGQFNQPEGIKIDASGNLWVVDTTNARVQEFSSSGSYLNQLGSGHLGLPTDLVIDSGGNLWVADQSYGALMKFNSSGVYQSQFGGGYGTGNGDFENGPAGVAIDSNGNFWLTDTTNNRVQEFNSSGTYIGQIGCATGACSTGTGNSQFNGPRGIAIGGR